MPRFRVTRNETVVNSWSREVDARDEAEAMERFDEWFHSGGYQEEPEAGEPYSAEYDVDELS